jgi:DNA-binding MarR family transcriptional regulator
MSKQHYKASTYKALSSVGYMLKRANSLISGVVDPTLEAHGFTMVQYQILVMLRDGIAVNPRDICAQFRHNSGALTRVIDQLAERGLLERSRRDRDRRKVELELTPAGREVVETLIPLVVEKLNSALADFSSAEVQEFKRLLLKLNATLQSAVEPAASMG